ncbi:DUF397 domain-containing protein [Streptomyces sp. NBC_01618]|uniref:DUF397 domain-containing protein n=1 Tax=Streptomyces sp. NBC_01618 TaxID=2975900 RepID=UPI00386862C2|nr:DUF397 domain-containing protein [Streptomyces sp. NBC_01618]
MQYDPTQLTWRKSSYSSGNGQCLEVGHGVQDVTPVRDSKNAPGPLLVFRTGSWSMFLTAVKADTFSADA